MIEESKYIDILTDLYFILAERGYDTKAFPVSDEQPPLLSKLEEQLQKSIIAAAKSKSKESFFIERRGKINEETDPIYFKFHFQFNPAKAEVDIHALYAIMTNTEKIYIPRYNNDLPSTRYVLDDLNYIQLKKARKIIDTVNPKLKDQTKKPKL
jgi:hypothetical protein